ncbi:MAG TPA: alpha/beta hydrolase family protein [Nocardioides sp.]|nr:alpha/beta hydrolase family protein [Nocardioides sp.]
MALITCDFFSESLEFGQSMTVVLPQHTEAQVGVTPASDDDGDGPPVLYLLHGMSDDHTAWLRYTSIERYATAAGLAVVMPAVARSFYTDEAHGHAYWSFVADELPEIVLSFFRVSARPERTYVAGLSMGGYGAIKLALDRPGRYAAAASLSGALDIVRRAGEPLRGDEMHDRIFGGPPRPEHDLFALIDGAAPDDVPPLHISCGTEDRLLEDSREFVRRASARGFEVTSDFPTGDHEWGLWDRVIQDVIDWFPR